MAGATKAELAAQVKRLQISLRRATTKNVTLGKSLADALEREKATAEIVRVIGRSPADVQPVFDGIAKAALRLIGGVSAAVTRVAGNTLHLLAFTSTSRAGDERLASQFPCPVSKLRGHARAIKSRLPYYFNDTEKNAGGIREVARARGYRSAVFVPLLHEKVAIGTIGVSRRDPGAFSDHEVELLKTFAAQAVIAIENARLFNETKEALEQQTAISEILRVISASPTDVQPVLDTVTEHAARICEANDVRIFLVDGDVLRFSAGFGALLAPVIGDTRPIDRGLVTGRAVLDRSPIQVEDMSTARARKEFPLGSERHRAYGHRTTFAVPLLLEERALGVILLRRMEVRPFTPRQIDLLKTFADQAAIAIENVRLFKELEARNAELTESLEQQTATSDILRIISSSPTDTQPVFDAIVKSGVDLFGGMDVSLRLVSGDQHELVASTRALDGFAYSLSRDRMPSSRAILHKELVHVQDIRIEDWVDEEVRERAKRRGFRSLLCAPLMRGNEAIGTIAANRAAPGPFTDKQIALLKTFADQAVIAIENVRLFKELQARNAELTESLEQQTVTSEILRVISSSPTDTQPVFDAIVRAGNQLFGGMTVSLQLVREDHIEMIASTLSIGGTGRAWSIPGNDESYPSTRAVLRRELVQLPDIIVADWINPRTLQHASELGVRAMMIAPMVRGNTAIGTVNVNRTSAGLFTEKQAFLLQTFAAQAVIAIENVRLFKELQARNTELSESLEQQTATTNILGVISRSPTDIQPVLDAIAQSAARLCDATDVMIRQVDGTMARVVAHLGSVPILEATRSRAITNDAPGGRAILERRTFHIPDVLAPEICEQYPQGLWLRHPEGTYRSMLVVPMVREDAAIGVITVRRTEVRPFSDKQIKLLETFAAQAVIAIENVRLFKELEARNAELSESLEQQTATTEILRVISSSPTDVQPVFDAIAESAARLCGARDSAIRIVDGDRARIAAHFGSIPHADPSAAGLPILRGSFSGRAILERRTIHIPDTNDEQVELDFPETTRRRPGERFRTTLIVPLLREDTAIGTIDIRRQEAQPFSDKQIKLLQTFAAQAVIAIENVRLFKELQARNAEVTEALEQQTATADILRVISRSPTDLQPVFDAILENASRLCDANLATLGLYDGEKFEYVAQRGGTPEFLERLFGRGRFVPVAGTNVWRMISEQRPIHIRDLPNNAQVRSPIRLFMDQGARTILAVPMLKEGRVVGGINIFRPEVRPFSQKQIDLVSTFANQAVIAIENVRLFKELQAQTEALSRSVNQLTALGEVGQAISSTLDLETVLQTIVSHAMRLTGLDGGVIHEYDDSSGQLLLRAAENFDDDSIARMRGAGLRKGEGAVGISVATGEPTQVPDTHAADYPVRLRALLDGAGFRAILAVPLVREEQVVGALMMLRRTPGAFAPEIVDLLKTFATQSALAIQNARLFREIAEKGRQLEVASQHKSQFLASMSHELRTPLNAMLGFNEMILGEIYGPVPADIQSPLADIQASGKHLLRLINNVLDLAKIEAGRMELSFADYSVHDTVESVRSTLHPLAADKGLEFTISVAEDIPFAYGDFGRITQCLMNLAGNSLKFTRQGHVQITVDRKGDLLVYRVADTGIGIPPEKIDSLFTEFKQTDATIASEFGGTGLGLSITKKFVEMHGGRIWVESELGQGSEFIFEIPLRAGGGANSNA